MFLTKAIDWAFANGTLGVALLASVLWNIRTQSKLEEQIAARMDDIGRYVAALGDSTAAMRESAAAQREAAEASRDVAVTVRLLEAATSRTPRRRA